MPLRLCCLLFLPLFLVCCSEPADPVDPEPITLRRDNISLTVDPADGGRIVSLRYAGKEVLSELRDSMGFQYGSVSWPGPQADWNWPPPAAMDRDPYTVQKVEQHSVLLISDPDPATGLVLQKRYRLGPDSDIGLTYWITNRGDTTRAVGAWEVTRLPYSGSFEFFSDSLRVERGNARTLESDGNHHRIVLDDRQAHTTKVFTKLDTVPATYVNNGVALEKHTVVTDFYRVAPDQAPLEIYLAPKAGFVEFELHGDYRKLGFGETSTLRSKWVLRPVAR